MIQKIGLIDKMAVIRLNESEFKGLITKCVRSVLNEYSTSNSGDEFYTRLCDIVDELSHYNFRGEIVYCNCDNPFKSNFYRYFKENFDELGLRGLYATYMDDYPYAFYFNGVDEQRFKINSGRFQDNVEIMKRSTVIVTNPPFSDGLPVELIKMANDMGKKLIFLGPLSLPARKGAFDYFQNGKMNAGYNLVHYYDRPEGMENNKVPSSWYTNFEVERDPYFSGKKFDVNSYQRYDGKYSDIIDCSRIDLIPDDYDGLMGVPITIFNKLDRRQYDVLGNIRPTIDGKQLYNRVVIKRK